MVFSSSIFLFAFLPIVILFYFVVPNKYRNIVLLLASLVFYAWGEPKYILLMLVSIVVNYILAISIEEADKWKRILFVSSVSFNLTILFTVKYLNFSVDIVNKLFGAKIAIQQIALPIGISFFTFQIMSYVIDVYMGNVMAQRRLPNLALYISLFPQLIAGPIVRYIDVERQIEKRNTTLEGLYGGARRFAIGFSKKVLIADQLAPLADVIFSSPIE